MQVIELSGVGENYEYQFPDYLEKYEHYVDYIAIAEDRTKRHEVRIGFCSNRPTYGEDRIRVVVWIDKYPCAEFLGADDFEKSGEVLSVMKVGNKECGYDDKAIPERYTLFRAVGLKTRVSGSGVHNAWAIVANVADHKTMVTLAGLRKFEKKQ
jgi:hypothetical protein